MQATELPKLRVCTWYKKRKKEFKYGIDIKVDGKWYHLLEDTDKPFFFDTKREASQKIKEIKFEASTKAIDATTLTAKTTN